MARVPMNRVHPLVICHARQAYPPSRVQEAAAYLLQMSGAGQAGRTEAGGGVVGRDEGVKGQAEAEGQSVTPQRVKNEHGADMSEIQHQP